MTAPASSFDGEPALGDLLRMFWRARLWIVGGALAGLAAALVIMALAVPHYRATMLVSPTTRSGTPDISALFPDNASFAMEYVLQSFGPGDSSDFMRFETIIRENSVAARMLAAQESMADAVARSGRWTFVRGERPVTGEDMADWLQKNVKSEPVLNTRLKRISVTHRDPGFAVMLLHNLYVTADDLIRSEVTGRTENRISYLQNLLDKTTHPEHRRILTRLLMDQEQIRMILAVGEPFAAQMAEPPSASPRPVWPRRAVVFPACVLVGALIGYAVFGLRRRPDNVF